MKPICMYIVSSCLWILLAGCQQVRVVSVTVVEEEGGPIKDADVTVTYLGAFGDDTQRVTGKTDDLGTFVAKGSTVLEIVVQVTKDGYYATTLDDLNRKEDHDLKLSLRKKINPVPLYAKNVTLFFPENREWLGYDFELGDWLPPYGNGKSEDIQFRCDTQMKGPRDGAGTLEIRFKEGGGLKAERDKYFSYSEMKMVHGAPVEGYEFYYIRKEESIRNKERVEDSGYFFRTRIDKNGDDIVSANYGKIISDFLFIPAFAHRVAKNWNRPNSYATVSFTYYFNPTSNDRNLEFDPLRNLLKGLDSTERVHDP